MKNLQPGHRLTNSVFALDLPEQTSPKVKKHQIWNDFTDNEEFKKVLSFYTELFHIQFNQNGFSISLKANHHT